MNRFLCLAILAAACGSSSNPGGDDDTQPDAAHLDASQCTALAQSAANAATTCGTPLPAGGQASLEQWCKKGVAVAAACGGNPAGGLSCFASPDPSDWVCEAGQPYPSCNGDLGAALGAYCLIASGNPSCASGVHCSYDADCSSGMVCNSATSQCMVKSAYCIGLRCAYDVDCPTHEKCNSAEHACVGA
jgi:hypothetical protein